MTKANPATANAIQPRGFVRRVIENALKATIADLIMLGIARKPFLNALQAA